LVGETAEKENKNTGGWWWNRGGRTTNSKRVMGQINGRASRRWGRGGLGGKKAAKVCIGKGSEQEKKREEGWAAERKLGERKFIPRLELT